MQKTSNRTIVITGSNKGIGFSIFEKFLADNIPYDIISTSRSEKLGQEAIKTLKEKYPNTVSNLIYHQLDVNDEKSVDDFVAWVRNTHGKLDVLINNAGVGHLNPTQEQQLLFVKTNFFSVVSLTEKLLPLLTDDGKIINISSTSGSLSWIGATMRQLLGDENLTEEQLYEAGRNVLELSKDYPEDAHIKECAYPASKALLNAYTRKFLPKKLKEGQHYFSVCPGACRSDMGGFFELDNVFPAELINTTEEGADTPVYLTNLPFDKLSELQGQFVTKRQGQSY